ncbi:hypothetical protein [Cupriavidus sp. CuC1]|uniref:hypothetical protein n=1 Tax=Cupriavidus sp. CuC1 TaxID=3373131 RepID=UPI0037D0B3D5
MSESLLALNCGDSCVAAVHKSVTLNTLVASDPEWRDYESPRPASSLGAQMREGRRGRQSVDLF